jgi:hypothetical protein
VILIITNKTEIITTDTFRLPVKTQHHIFAQNILYSVGVELGKIYPLMREYVIIASENKNNEKKLEENIIIEYERIIKNLLKARSKKRQLEIIKGKYSFLEDYFKPKEQQQNEVQSWFEGGIERQGREYEKSIASALKEDRRDLTNSYATKLRDYLILSGHNTGDDTSKEVETITSIQSEFNKTEQTRKRKKAQPPK